MSEAMAACPAGHDSEASDYCDVCGARMDAPAPAPVAGQCPDCGTPRDGRFCEVCGRDFERTGSPEVPAEPTASPAAGWRLVASADPDHHARVGEGVAFPAYCPERGFDLGGARVLIGRRSRSRGIAPDIDLSGQPEDPGISHAHAMLLTGPDGACTVVDLGSANGTYLNDATEPLPPDRPHPIGDGDRIHIGAWTTLTLQRPVRPS
ncbi:FHA domain-containing protein [Dactylosporangium sp. CA-233914]|uniref:FHA domain-containing protein n=1 Tax=Dactylosporangium sp. CA-233914 TaxID=3239934 RepID=UPI003D905B57